MYIAN